MTLLSGAALIWAQQPSAPADLATSIKNQYKQNQGFILASAEKWPEDGYGWRPAGLEGELRTFAGILVHTANENNMQCNRAQGKPDPKPFDDTNAAYTKAEATKIIKDSFTFCDAVFEALTNENMTEMITLPGRGGANAQRARATSLILDLTHSNEQYGIIMTYFALKGMVPVSHAK
jgi:hypothetical protein